MKKWIGVIGIVLLVSLGLMTNVLASKSWKYDEFLSYVYIEYPEMTAGQTQRIGLILEDDITADTFELVYESQTTGKQYVVPAAEESDGTIVFEWIPEEGADCYQIVRLEYTDENGKQKLVIKDENFMFLVEEEISDVVSLDDLQKEDILSAVTQKKMAAEVAESLEKTMLHIEPPKLYQNTRKQNIVIALDAGHDSSHAGAQGNGVIEELVTLKLAQYAKEELETYEGVTVYMTRTGASCPYPSTIGTASANDIMKRIDAAVSAGAQAVISFHLNSYTTASPKGCLVLCPQGNDSIAVDALELSEKILEKLCAVGFENDGMRQEKWTITSYARQKGIPGIIIEHGFVSNPEDAAKLKDEAYVKAMGAADAQGIAEFYGLQKKKPSVGQSLHVGSGEYYIESAGNANIALNIATSSPADHAAACIDEKGDLSSQNFVIKRQGNGYYQILNKNSGLALGISASSGENNLSVSQSVWTGADEQLWEFLVTQDGYCYIRSKLGTYLTRILDGSPKGCHVVTYEHLGLEKQGWKITPFEKKTTEIPFLKRKIKEGKLEHYEAAREGIFLIHPEHEPMVMMIADGSKEEGSCAVLGAEKETDAAQHWTLVEDGAYFQLKNVNSGKVLSIEAVDGVNGSKISQMVWNESDHQRWEFLESGSGSYFIRSESGFYLGYQSGTVCLVSENEKPSWVLVGKGYSIMGESRVSVAEMVNCYNKNHKSDYPSDVLGAGGAPTITDFCRILKEEADAEGVRAEVAFAQVILETGWLRFTGAVQPNWYNFCGLGAIDTNAAGNAAHFADVREGLRAQMQHLKAYGNTEVLNYECVDPRFKLVKRGCAPYVQWLGAKDNPRGYGWSSSQGYGTKLMNLIYSM